MNIALLHTTIREDEKLLIRSAKSKKIPLDVLDVRELVFNPGFWKRRYDVVLERCISTTLGSHAVMFFESLGMQVVNSSEVSLNCDNKFLTSLKLVEHKVPTVPFLVAFSEGEAIQAVGELGGYPVVIKPVSGSWGRLLAKVNDSDSLEAVIEQKRVLGSPIHKVYYIQKYIQKPGRDIRVMVVDNTVTCAIYRESDHWIANTARGARAKNCKVDPDLEKISLKAAKAVGGGILGIDVFESREGYLINEINHTPEFKNVQRVTGVDISGVIIDYCKNVTRNK